ncbi:hypothetical protein N9996_04225 [Synechococcus sp. AH-603-M21]|nr:hypothetical protein [Synechococcus sp. AH-603-M21]
MTTATETTTFYFDLEASGTLCFEAPVGTDPQTIIDAAIGQLRVDHRLDLPEGISLSYGDLDNPTVYLVDED